MREYNVVLGFSSEGSVEGWLNYFPQDQTNFSSEGLTNLHFFAVMHEYNVVLGFSSEGAVEGWLHYSPQDQTNFSSEGVATYKGEIIQATREFG